MDGSTLKDEEQHSTKMTKAAELAHLVQWDVEFNRPVVDGNIAHPITGEIQQAGGQGFRTGPPSIDVKLINLNLDTKPFVISMMQPVSLEDLYLAVARHVHDGIYSLTSVSASSYSFVIVCEVLVSEKEYDVAVKNMFCKKADYKYSDEEWDAYLAKKFTDYADKAKAIKARQESA